MDTTGSDEVNSPKWSIIKYRATGIKRKTGPRLAGSQGSRRNREFRGATGGNRKSGSTEEAYEVQQESGSQVNKEKQSQVLRKQN
jgi:hypothetical protein